MVEANHVFACDAEVFAVGVDVAHAGLAGVRVAYVSEQQRYELAVLNADHRAAAAVHQKANGGIAEFAAVMLIERDRVAATQFVADVFIRHHQLDAALFEAAFDFDFDLAREINFGEADVAVFVALYVLQVGEFVGVELVNHAFGQHGNAVKAAFGAALDDRTFDDVAEVRERNDVAAELFADNRQRSARRFADAEREMSGLASHRHDDVPTLGGARVFHQVLHEFGADVPRRLKAKRRNMRRQRQIVINGFRHVYRMNVGFRRYRARRKRRVVAADCDEVRDAYAFEGFDDGGHGFF